jgi:glycosyltransferase involved in cell wall biosynthesis
MLAGVGAARAQRPANLAPSALEQELLFNCEPASQTPPKVQTQSDRPISSMRLIKKGRGECASDAVPVVSVVVPTCGRPHLLERCLDALAHQQLEGGFFEIIVVDDRPSTATKAVCRSKAVELIRAGNDMQYVASPGPHGPAAARNRGWRLARSEIVAFTDDDTVPDALWLANGLKALDHSVGAVCGRVVMPIPRLPTDYERDASGLARAEFVTANCFCRKAVLERVSGFDERFKLAWREDSDLQFKILETGAGIGYAEDAVVVHPVRPARWGISLQQQKKVMFDALLFKNHPRLYRARIRNSPRWDYYAIVAAMLGAIASGLYGSLGLAAVLLGLWGVLTARFCMQRLRGTAHTVSHVAEMIVTSVLIPPLAVFWRVAGMLKFRVGFA